MSQHTPYNLTLALPEYANKVKNPQNVQAIRKYGYCASVGSGAYETIWTVGGEYPWQSSAQEIFVASTDGGDAGDVLIWGIDSGNNKSSVRATIAGQTTVSIGTGFVNIERARAKASFTGTINAGVGAFTAGVPATNLLQIGAAAGATKMGLTTLPSGYVGCFSRALFTAQKAADVLIRVRIPGYAWWDVVDERINDAAALDIDFTSPETGPGRDENGDRIFYSAGTQVEARAKAAVSSGIVTVNMWLLLCEIP